MVVIYDLKSTTINSETQKVVDKNSKVIKDDYKSHSKLKEIIKEHKAYNSKNIKAIHYCTKEPYLQN